jgi:hypothetical protein
MQALIDDHDLDGDSLAFGLAAKEGGRRVDALKDLPGLLGTVGEGDDDRELLHTKLLSYRVQVLSGNQWRMIPGSSVDSAFLGREPPPRVARFPLYHILGS